MSISTPSVSTRDNPIEYSQATAENKKYRVTLGFKGDGYHGKYNPDVVEEDGQIGDRPCLRLELFAKEKSKWNPVEFGSFVTYLLATDKQEEIQACADFIIEEIGKNNNKLDNDFLEKLRYIHLRGGKPYVMFPERD